VNTDDFYEGYGRAKLPPGYGVLHLDSGHFMWVLLCEDDPTDWTIESSIHWDRWAVWRGAWADYNARTAEALPAGVTAGRSPEEPRQ
jgi:hypothetical protein